MGIFDFFRKKLSNIKSQEEDKLRLDRKKTLKFEELETWLADKKKNGEKEEEETIKEIEILISQLVLELNEENEEIGKVDLKDRKAEERVKIIVLENLSNYSHYVDVLVENLERLKKESLQEIIKDINKKFTEFKQKSNLSFEKATFLVGKELERPRESIRNFFEKLNNLAEENKNIFENSTQIQIIEQKFQEIKRLENSKIEITKELIEIEKIKLRTETEEKILEEEIKKIKNSEEYAEWEKRRQESNLRKKEIEKEIFEVKNMIDWKNLAKIFHTNEKKMIMIKEYESHFSQIFEKEGENKFLEILQEANIETREILERVMHIRKKTKEVHEVLNSKDKLSEHAPGIIGLRAEIKNFLIEKEKILKRIQKVDESISDIKKDICSNIKKLGIFLSD